jgi:hypothetical protein
VALLQQLLAAATVEGPPELVRGAAAALRQLANSDAVKVQLAEAGALSTLMRWVFTLCYVSCYVTCMHQNAYTPNTSMLGYLQVQTGIACEILRDEHQMLFRRQMHANRTVCCKPRSRTETKHSLPLPVCNQ